MQNALIAALFEETADLLEIQGANSFRVRAYRNAARTIESAATSLLEIVQQGGDLTRFEGIGTDLAGKITAIVTTGQFEQLNELRDEVPAGVRDMLRLPGIGPKKVSVLFRELQVKSLDDLKAAAEAGRVAQLKGFGAKTQQSILEGIATLGTTDRRVLRPIAHNAVTAIIDDLRKSGLASEVEAAGSCRRCKESIHDLDVLATGDDAGAVMDCLAENPAVDSVLQRGETKQRVRLKNGLELDLRVVPRESFGAAWQYFTGSKEHNVALRGRAKDLGLKVNEYGVFRGDERIAGATEEDVYRSLGLPWIPPELRENRGEFERAEQGRLPRLIEAADLKGDLHMHTTATDGTADIRTMAEAAMSRGLEYIAITDHSKRVVVANGLDADRLRAHWAEIRRVRESIPGIRVLCGIECDILEDATLDLPDDVLAEADWVIAVLHFGLKQPREQIQQRLLNAIRNPHVDAIGHLTGRLIGSRAGADVDFGEVARAAADFGVMLEINANPSRLDLDDVQAAAARDLGIPIVINSDAHSVNGFDVLPWGVDQARRAGLEAKDVANTRPWSEFERLLAARRSANGV